VDSSTWVQTSDFYLLFADEHVTLHESFEVRNAVLYIHHVEASELIGHANLEVIPVLAVVGTPT